jgi:hypothetical protein
MKRLRVRDDNEQGEFAVKSVRQIDAETRSFIAKAVTLSGVIALMLTAGFFAMRGDDARLVAIASVIGNLLSFILGCYFRRGKIG